MQEDTIREINHFAKKLKLISYGVKEEDIHGKAIEMS